MNKQTLKIRKKLLLPIALAATTALGLGMLVACGDEGYSEDDVHNMGFIHAIDYYFDGGIVNEKDNARVRVSDGSYVPEPGKAGSNIDLPVKNGYSLRDFCYAKTNADGELELKDGKPIADETRVFDFSTYKADGDVSIVARWWDNYSVVLHYGEGYTEQKIGRIPRTPDGSPTNISSTFFNVSDYTFLDYFYDEAESEKAVVSGVFTAEQFVDSDTLEIYGKSLNGSYELIDEASDFSNFYMSATTNLYFLDSVDMTDYYTEDDKFEFPSNYSGKIIGNGYTITGLQADFTPAGMGDTDFGLFKSISDGAEITDITFKDVKINLNLTNSRIAEYNIGLFAGRIRSGAKIEKVQISGSIEYEVVVGYDIAEKVNFGGIIGELASDVEPDVKLIPDAEFTVTSSEMVYTASKDYAVYAKVTQTASGKSIKSVYGLASVGEGNALSGLRLSEEVVKNENGSYTLKTSTDTYTVTVTVSGDDLSATVVKA
ncbi:MAG: hypothetical protein HDT28_03290 [Clostridiales bacterium]|nr:hypothetical protein [Clostridiales bacterium]